VSANFAEDTDGRLNLFMIYGGTVLHYREDGTGTKLTYTNNLLSTSVCSASQFGHYVSVFNGQYYYQCPRSRSDVNDNSILVYRDGKNVIQKTPEDDQDHSPDNISPFAYIHSQNFICQYTMDNLIFFFTTEKGQLVTNLVLKNELSW
jgi:hypothetical protein